MTAGPSDSAFYLSGTIVEGVAAFKVDNPANFTYTSSPLGVVNGSVIFAGSYLTAPGISAPATLPSNGNVPFSASAWVLCEASSQPWAAVLEWGGPTGYLQGAASPRTLSLGVGGALGDVSVPPLESIIVSTLAGSSIANLSDGLGSAARFSNPQDVAVLPSGTFVVADTQNNCIRLVTPTGTVSTLAGSVSGYKNAVGTAAMFNGPTSVAVYLSTIIVADTGNHVIRLISQQGRVSTLAGSGKPGFADGTGTKAMFHTPTSVDVDPSNGLVYVTDEANDRIRTVYQDGLVTTFAEKKTTTTCTPSNFPDLGSCDCDSLLDAPHRVAFIASTGSIVVSFASALSIYLLTQDCRLSNLDIGLTIQPPTSLSAIPMSSSILVAYGINASTTGTALGIFSTSELPVLTQIAGHISGSGYADGLGLSAKLHMAGISFSQALNGIVVVDSNRLRLIQLPLAFPACDSSWHHIALLYSPTGSLSGFLDGALIFSLRAAITLPSPASSVLRIGWSGNLTAYGGSLFSGALSELRVYHRALQISEVIALSQPPPLGFPGLVLSGLPTPGATSYSYSCAAGFVVPLSQGQATLKQSPIDNSWGWASGFAPVCDPCPPGSASSQLNALSCSPCAVGSYSASPGAAVCTLCPAGSFGTAPNATSQALACKQCPLGTFSGLSGQASCVQLCPVGSYGITNAMLPPTSFASACAFCPAGSFSSQPAATFCSICAVGYFSDADGAGQCSACPSGTYGVAPNATSQSEGCALCPVGTFSSAPGQSSCAQECPPGYYGLAVPDGLPTSTAIACSPCPAGSYSSQSRATACILCVAGSFSTSPGSPSCTACPPGFFGTVLGATEEAEGCQVCPTASFSGSPGATSCALTCPAGTFGIANHLAPPTSAAIACASCAAGSYSAAGALNCTYCSVGFYSAASGAVFCTACEAGTFGTAPGASNATTACSPCAEGTYNSLTGQSIVACLACPSGTASASPGAASKAACVSCAAGSFATTGSTVCSPCPPGTFSASYGAAACTPCPRNTYNPQGGSTSATACLACPAGTFTAIGGSSEATDCAAGIFSCPSGTQSGLAGNAPPKSLADCVALTCAPPLVPARIDGTMTALSLAVACVGCTPGASGSPASACLVCAAGLVCPGLLGAPLPNASALALMSAGALGPAALKTISGSATTPVPVAWACAGGALGTHLAASQQALGATEAAVLQTAPAAAAAYSLDTPSLSIIVASLTIAAATFVMLIVFVMYRFREVRVSKLGDMLSSSSSSGASFSTASSSSVFDGSGAVPATFSALQAPSVAAQVRRRRRVDARAADTIGHALETVDAFSLAHQLSRGDVVTKLPTPMGGAFSVAGVCTLVMLAAVLALRRQQDNVLRQQSLAVLDAPTLAAIEGKPWALTAALAAPSGGTRSSGGSAAPQALRVRVLVAGAAGAACGAPGSWSTNGVRSIGGVGDGFALQSATSAAAAVPCAQGSAAPGAATPAAAVFQLAWTCADCLFSPTSALSFTLPIFCQSIAIEVAAAASDGSISILSSGSNGGALTATGASAAAAAAGAASAPSSATPGDGSVGGGLLTSLEWNVLPLLDMLSDQQPGAAVPLRLGYTLVDGGVTVIRAGAASALTVTNGSAPKVALAPPDVAGVHVRVGLSLQPYYSSTTLSQKQSLLQLFASIVGLSGLFGIFGLLFQVAEGSIVRLNPDAFVRPPPAASNTKHGASQYLPAGFSGGVDLLKMQRRAGAGPSALGRGTVAALHCGRRVAGDADGGTLIESTNPLVGAARIADTTAAARARAVAAASAPLGAEATATDGRRNFAPLPFSERGKKMDEKEREGADGGQGRGAVIKAELLPATEPQFVPQSPFLPLPVPVAPPPPPPPPPP